MAPKVLFVDDEPNVTAALKNILRKEAYEILTADSAAAALDMIRRMPISVLVIDEQMPEIPGSELIVQLRREQPDLICILLTGHASPEAAIRAIRDGEVYRFLTKPCNGVDLAVTIRRALQYQQLFTASRRMVQIIHLETHLLKNWRENHRGAIDLDQKTPPDLFQLGNNINDLLIHIQDELKQAQDLLGITEPAPDMKVPASPKSSGLNQIPPAATRKSVDEKKATQTAGAPLIPAGNQVPGPLNMKKEAQVRDFQELKPIMLRSEIQGLLDQCGELKGMSPTVNQVLQMTRQSQCSLDKLVRIIKQDPAISLKILKMANSSVYTRGEPVSSVNTAVMRIGLTQIQQTVLNLSVIDQFGIKNSSALNIHHFWEHSIATGLIAAELTRELLGKDAQVEAAFTMGLLHDVGRMVYLEILGEKYLKVIETAQRLQLPLEQVESRMLLINHADAMERILRAWRLAKELVTPIAMHQLSIGNIRQLAPHNLKEVGILSLANRLAHALLLGSSGNLTIYPIQQFISVLGLKPEFIRQLEQEIPDKTGDIKYTLLSTTNQNWPRLRDELTRQLHQPFRPLFIASEPDYEPLRILCDCLRDTTEGEPFNVGIIYLDNSKERMPLGQKLLDAETKAGSGPLNLMMISPNGNLTLDDKLLIGRNCQLLPYPLAITRLLETVNELTAAVLAH